MTASARARELLQLAAVAADSKAGEDLVALDVTGPLPFADVFLLISGNSERNVVAISDAVEDALGERGVSALRREGREQGRWVLLDFGDLVVHVFNQQDRQYYALERLWRDCPVVPLELPHSAVAGQR